MEETFDISEEDKIIDIPVEVRLGCRSLKSNH